jgi:sphingomyelin phosphodiesterase 2
MKIFTLNCWGIPYITPNITDRMESIGKFLKDRDYDIICLQEVWFRSDFELIHTYLDGYYSIWFGNRSGLVTFSKHDFCEAHYQPLLKCGNPCRFWEGDIFVNKGIGSITILDGITIINTHFQSWYTDEMQYLNIQCSNVNQLRKYIQSVDGDCIILGDFNISCDSILYQTLSDFLQDTYINAGDKNGKTYENYRMDYIFTSFASDVEYHNFELACNIPGTNIQYSDHCGIEVLLNLN